MDPNEPPGLLFPLPITPAFLRNPTSASSSPLPNSPAQQPRQAAPPFPDLSDDDLQRLTTMVMRAMQTRGLGVPSPPTIMTPKHDIYDNARFEQIACSGLQPTYDGSADRLIPTLDLIHLRRQNEVWYPATFVVFEGKSVDLIKQFSRVPLSIIQQRAKTLWDVPNVDQQRHTRGTDLYSSRLFGLFLLNSLTPAFAALLQSRIDQRYGMDGPLLFMTMCSHVHRNHLAFVESIKHKIRLGTLAEYKNDVPAYLRFLHDNLRVITSTGDDDKQHNDLLTHIFMQLRYTTIPIFQQKVLQWHRAYMENTLQTSPLALVTMADEECQILRHSQQWVETIDPSIIAMQAFIAEKHQGTTTIFEQLKAHLSQLQPSSTHRQSTHATTDQNEGRRQYRMDNPVWVYDAPDDLLQKRTFQGRVWNFCTKCGRNGKWVCTHTDDTHRVRRDYLGDRNDGRNTAGGNSNNGARHGMRSRSRTPPPSRDPSPLHNRSRSVQFRPTPPASPSAKLSLFDSINAFIADE